MRQSIHQRGRLDEQSFGVSWRQLWVRPTAVDRVIKNVGPAS